MLGKFGVLECEDDFEYTGDPGGRLKVPDVRLCRTDQQRVRGVPTRAQSGRGGLHLDGIAQRGAGPVRLQIVDIGGGHSGAVECLGDDPLLGDAVGHRQPT